MMKKSRLIPLTLAIAASLSAGAIAGSISTSTTNGETVVHWNGKEVFRGAANGPIAAKSRTVNGEEFAAVFAGDRVLWENKPGAAAAIGSAPAPKLPPIDPGKKPEQGHGIKVETNNGEAVIHYEGKDVWRGKAKGQVRSAAHTIDGEKRAAAWDEERLLWENVKGAGKELRRHKPNPGLPPLKGGGLREVA